MKDRPHADKLNYERIVSCLDRELSKILADQPVMLAYLFGSVVDRTVTAFSDVDLALVFDPDYDGSDFERMQIEFAIAEEVENRCSITETDVRSMDTAPLVVQGRVLTHGVLVYSRDDVFRVDYEVSIRKRYFDFLPVSKMMQKAFFQHVSQEGLSHGES